VAGLLNEQLKEKDDELHLYTDKFVAVNGFINVHLTEGPMVELVRDVILKDRRPEKTGEAPAQELSYTFKPIGCLESVFREKFGTPRQSGFVKNARARLTITNEIDSSCLDGLEGFGYIWVVFVFHKDLEGAGYNNKKSKIAPPKLEGEKMGVFATRSPHRFNPIGLSIAKVDKVDKRTIYMSGIDLVHGTPIMDIKPYHYLDALPESE